MSLNIDKCLPDWNAHCKGNFMREFAYKPLPHESPLNLVRIHRIGSLDKLAGLVRAYSNRPGFYVSVYAFEPKNSPGKLDYDTAIIDRLYLDFDSKEDLSMALYETRITRDALQDLSIEAHSYFSGLKGTANYIDFSPTPIAVENKKEVLGLFWDMIKEGIGLQLPTLDGGSVRGDIARVSRLPNTRHQSGLFCIPLEKMELLRGADYIRMLAREPRNDFDLEARMKENIRSNSATVPGLLKALEELVIERKEEAEKTKPKPIIRKSQSTKGFVTHEQIQCARSYPISEILGNNKMALCPFHNDVIPSLSIDHKRGLWHCFACNSSGNVIQLVMRLEGLDFKAAVRKLACRHILASVQHKGFPEPFR